MKYTIEKLQDSSWFDSGYTVSSWDFLDGEYTTIYCKDETALIREINGHSFSKHDIDNYYVIQSEGKFDESFAVDYKKTYKDHEMS